MLKVLALYILRTLAVFLLLNIGFSLFFDLSIDPKIDTVLSHIYTNANQSQKTDLDTRFGELCQSPLVVNYTQVCTQEYIRMLHGQCSESFERLDAEQKEACTYVLNGSYLIACDSTQNREKNTNLTATCGLLNDNKTEEFFVAYLRSNMPDTQEIAQQIPTYKYLYGPSSIISQDPLTIGLKCIAILLFMAGVFFLADSHKKALEILASWFISTSVFLIVIFGAAYVSLYYFAADTTFFIEVMLGNLDVTHVSTNQLLVLLPSIIVQVFSMQSAFFILACIVVGLTFYGASKFMRS